MRLMKGSWVAFVFKSGRGKKGGGIKTFSLGYALKNQEFYLLLYFLKQRWTSVGEGAKTVFCVKIDFIKFCASIFFFLKNRLKL